MPEFLTVKQAAQRTGKSPSAIRRIIHPIARNDEHVDRHHIHPTPEDVRDLRQRGVNFPWQISDELLRRAIPEVRHAERENATGGAAGREHAAGDLVAILRSELATKNEQIAVQSKMLSQQMELISGLSERLREGNVLIATLQQRLALTEGPLTTKAGPIDAVETKRETVVAKPKGDSAPPAKKAEPKTMPNKPNASQSASKATKPKRGFLARLFG